MDRKDTSLKIRIDRQTLEAAKEKARGLDVPLSQVIRQWLREWVAEPVPAKEDRQENDN